MSTRPQTVPPNNSFPEDNTQTRAERLRAVRQYLDDYCPYANLLRDVHLDFDQSGALCLSGSVASYYLRQVAVAFVLKAVRNMHICDRLKVTDLS